MISLTRDLGLGSGKVTGFWFLDFNLGLIFCMDWIIGLVIAEFVTSKFKDQLCNY